MEERRAVEETVPVVRLSGFQQVEGRKNGWDGSEGSEDREGERSQKGRICRGGTGTGREEALPLGRVELEIFHTVRPESGIRACLQDWMGIVHHDHMHLAMQRGRVCQKD